MKIKANLGFMAKLEANVPENSIAAKTLGVVNVQGILDQGRKLVAPLLQKALLSGLMQLKVIGIEVKVLESHVDLIEGK